MFRDIAPKAKGKAVPRARRLRKDMSLPEVMLWQALRSRPSGLKFRRQHASGPFVLDFYCGDARLAVEIDGEAHSRGDRPEQDAARDAYFSNAGVWALRIAAADVLVDLNAVVAMIVSEAQKRLPLHHPASPGGPPPRDKLGEE